MTNTLNTWHSIHVLSNQSHSTFASFVVLRVRNKIHCLYVFQSQFSFATNTQMQFNSIRCTFAKIISKRLNAALNLARKIQFPLRNINSDETRCSFFFQQLFHTLHEKFYSDSYHILFVHHIIVPVVKCLVP